MTMDYEKKYREVKELIEDCTPDKDGYIHVRPSDIFPELAENEDEMIRKHLIGVVELYYGNTDEQEKKDCLAWLEKQGEHQKFVDSIQIGDKVTRNEDGVLVNLSQLKRIAKPVEEYNITGIGSKNAQGKLGEMIKNLKPINEVLEQKPADKVEPKLTDGFGLSNHRLSITQIQAIENYVKNYVEFINS